jgi:hypothetical protein
MNLWKHRTLQMWGSFREKGRLALLRHPLQPAAGMRRTSRLAIQPFWRKREPSYF